ncbi:MAG: redoxin domain-containing protein [Bacteroidota bacterium]|nr:redoxin domain-containing protein [Bacteroidota bacterium]
MRQIIFFLFIIFFSHTACAQYKVEGVIENYNNRKLMLADFYGDQKNIIDSTRSSESGIFSFSFPENRATGMYRIILDNRDFFDFIFNKEDVRLIAKAENPMQSATSVESIENDLYYSYLDTRNKSLYKLDLLNPVIRYYPEENEFYTKALEEFVAVQDGLYDFVDSLRQQFPDAFATRIALMEREPQSDPLWNPFEESLYKRKHFFDDVDFSDTSLLRSNVISTKIISYLSLYQNKNFSKEQLENSFKQAVDTILKVTRPYPLLYEFALDYLISGFEQYGFNGVIEYIAGHATLEEDCEYSENASKLEQRIETLKKLSNGNTAPDFTASDIEGNEVSLTDTKNNKTLLVFWASWCPHCTHMLPGLKDYFEQNKEDLRVIAVSIDSSRSDFMNFIREGNYAWTNIADFKGWNNEVAELYGIYATPTLILLDADRKILGKPNDVGELREMMGE